MKCVHIEGCDSHIWKLIINLLQTANGYDTKYDRKLLLGLPLYTVDELRILSLKMSDYGIGCVEMCAFYRLSACCNVIHVRTALNIFCDIRRSQGHLVFNFVIHRV